MTTATATQTTIPKTLTSGMNPHILEREPEASGYPPDALAFKFWVFAFVVMQMMQIANIVSILFSR